MKRPNRITPLFNSRIRLQVLLTGGAVLLIFLIWGLFSCFDLSRFSMTNQSAPQGDLPSFHRADNFLYDCPARYEDDNEDADRGFIESLRILCGGKLFFKPTWAQSVSTIRQLVLKSGAVSGNSKMLLIDAPVDSSFWWDFPYLSFTAKIQADIPQWWPCHWNLAFPVDNATFLLPVCGLTHRQGSQQAFIKIYALNLKGELLQSQPVFERSWNVQAGIPLLTVFPKAGRSIVALQLVDASLHPIHRVKTTLFTFHHLRAVEMLTFDARFQGKQEADCSVQHGSNHDDPCWVEERFLDSDFESIFQKAAGQGQWSLTWRLAHGSHVQTVAFPILNFNEKTWGLTAPHSTVLFSNESTLATARASLPANPLKTGQP
jgi:hypothetical protein